FLSRLSYKIKNISAATLADFQRYSWLAINTGKAFWIGKALTYLHHLAKGHHLALRHFDRQSLDILPVFNDSRYFQADAPSTCIHGTSCHQTVVALDGLDQLIIR